MRSVSDAVVARQKQVTRTQRVSRVPFFGEPSIFFFSFICVFMHKHTYHRRMFQGLAFPIFPLETASH